MAEERRMNASQFEGVNTLARRIDALTKERDALTKDRENTQTKLLEDHTATLASMQTTLALIVERTKDLPKLGDRVTKLESWKAFVGGIAASFTILGGSIGWVVGFLVKNK
jgi:translation elongation factor EF-1alpha